MKDQGAVKCRNQCICFLKPGEKIMGFKNSQTVAFRDMISSDLGKAGGTR